MKKTKSAKLERVGYRLTNAQEFLGLSVQEMAVIDLKISLIQKLKEVRRTSGITQKELAKIIKSSQSRVAMLENGASDVSLELICKALFALGVTSKEIGKAISGARAA
jgi:DNA-binding XRE family transcriptional regulator